MPIGAPSAVPFIVESLVTRKPRAVLDLGIGFGLYGAVVRQWLDKGVAPFRTDLQGVEGWVKYRSPLWDLYDRVVIKKIQDFHYFNPNGNPWDFMILSDVLEHFEKKEGHVQLQRAIEHLGPKGVLMVSTPAVFCKQGAAHGNDLERHRSFWEANDLDEIGFEVLWDGEKPMFQNRMLVARYVKD